MDPIDEFNVCLAGEAPSPKSRLALLPCQEVITSPLALKAVSARFGFFTFLKDSMNTNIFLTLAIVCFFPFSTVFAGDPERLAEGLESEGQESASTQVMKDAFMESLSKLDASAIPYAAVNVEALKIDGELQAPDFDSLVGTFLRQLVEPSEQSALLLAIIFQDNDKATFQAVNLAITQKLRELTELKEKGQWTPQAQAQELALLNMIGTALLVGGKEMDSENLYLLYSTVSGHVNDMMELWAKGEVPNRALRPSKDHRVGLMGRFDLISFACFANIKADYIGDQLNSMIRLTLDTFYQDLKQGISRRVIFHPFKHVGIIAPPGHNVEEFRSILLSSLLLEEAGESLAQNGKLKLERLAQLKAHLAGIRSGRSH